MYTRYAQFLSAWRSGEAGDYADALRSAYHFTDVAIDHASKTARMHGYPLDALSLPMARVLGTVAAYLETGDPYLIDTARAVTETAHWTNRNPWPRLAIGRDACYTRGAVMLYRYFADDHFKRIAEESIGMLLQTQRADGTFGDQAGGTGTHQWGAFITKPWMGLLALGGVLDYLELFPDNASMLRAVRRFADWLLASRVDHGDGRSWSYQHAFDGQSRFYNPLKQAWIDLPDGTQWHQETLARLMGFCTLRFGDPAYLDAWAESHAITPEPCRDHPVSAALQFLPWLQAKLWNATLTTTGVTTSPIHFGTRTPAQGKLMSPAGPLSLAWTDQHRIDLPPQADIEPKISTNDSEPCVLPEDANGYSRPPAGIARAPRATPTPSC